MINLIYMLCLNVADGYTAEREMYLDLRRNSANILTIDRHKQKVTDFNKPIRHVGFRYRF